MIVVLDLWRVPVRAVPLALWHMARDPSALSGLPGLQFHKSLGTGAGRRFTAADADLRQWALLTCWQDVDAPLDPLRRRWNTRATAHTRLTLGTIASHGQWSGREPFTADPDLTTHQGPLAAITRARVRTRQWRAFQRAVPPVAVTLDAVDGLLFRIGIGEAPVGLQGTFSVWRDAAALREFAYRQPQHRAVIEQTHRSQWYAEELFARFALLDVAGDPLW